MQNDGNYFLAVAVISMWPCPTSLATTAVVPLGRWSLWLQEALGSAPAGRTIFFSAPRARAEHSDTKATALMSFYI